MLQAIPAAADAAIMMQRPYEEPPEAA